MPNAPSKIRLLITDVDGCLTQERAEPFDLDLFRQIREYIQKSKVDRTIPEITLCTGRPQPYAEALMKTLAMPGPGISENGGIIYRLSDNQYVWEDAINSEWTFRLHNLKQRIIREVLPRVNAAIQPGKETHITLIAPSHQAIIKTLTLLKAHFDGELDDYNISVTENCFNLVPNFFDKGTALHKLVQLTGIQLSQMAAVGDTKGDLPFLRLVKYPMCPANAVSEVKAICSYVAPKPYTAGLIEIIETCIAINKGDWIIR